MTAETPTPDSVAEMVERMRGQHSDLRQDPDWDVTEDAAVVAEELREAAAWDLTNGYDGATSRVVTRQRMLIAAEMITALAAEVEALRAAISESLLDLIPGHHPMWGSAEAEEAGKEPIGCATCFPSDGGWPCVTAMVADDLHSALSVSDDHPETEDE